MAEELATPKVIVVEDRPVREVAPVVFFDRDGPDVDQDLRPVVEKIAEDDRRDFVTGEVLVGQEVRPVHPNDPRRKASRPTGPYGGVRAPEGADNGARVDSSESSDNGSQTGQIGPESETNSGKSGDESGQTGSNPPLSGGPDSTASVGDPPAGDDPKGAQKPIPAQP